MLSRYSESIRNWFISTDRFAVSVCSVQSSNSILTTLAHQPLSQVPDGAQVMTAMVELPPGHLRAPRPEAS
jgi:hypothetical protein